MRSCRNFRSWRRPVGDHGATCPARRFQYGSAPFQIVGELVRRKLAARGDKAGPLAYIDRRIFWSIGIAPVQWRRSADGNPLMAAGAALTARQWARFGEFVRLGGKWEGSQLVDPATLAGLFQGSSANPAYGASWWLAVPVPEAERPRQLRNAVDLAGSAQDFPRGIVLAVGKGRQRLAVVPSENLVIVRQTDNRKSGEAGEGGGVEAGAPDLNDGRWSDTQFLKLALGIKP